MPDEIEIVDPPERVTEVPRDQWGRPRIFPLQGGKATGYRRCTSFVGCLEDQYAVHAWQQRMTAIGLSLRADLLLSVAANVDDVKELNKIVERAREAAKANSKSTTGTALHGLCEQYDMGLTPHVPERFRPDIAAYLKATKIFNVLSIEEFCVLDLFGGIGGTPDRVVEFLGRNYILDIKTGSIEHGMLKFAMQFAVYAHSRPYFFKLAPGDPDTDLSPQEAAELRGEWPGEIDKLRAILVHLPQGEGRCDIYMVNISDGWEAVKIAAAVHQWRRRARSLVSPFHLEAEMAKAEIRQASSVDQLRVIYDEFVKAGHDGKLILQDCKDRKSEIMHQEAHEEFVRSKTRGSTKGKG